MFMKNHVHGSSKQIDQPGGGAKKDGAGFHTCKVSSSLSKVAASILERRNQSCAWNMGMRKE